MRTGTFAAAILNAAIFADLAHAKETKPTALDMEAQIETMESVVSECKGKFQDTLTTFYPQDIPNKALEDMSLIVCLDYANFIPRKQSLTLYILDTNS